MKNLLCRAGLAVGLLVLAAGCVKVAERTRKTALGEEPKSAYAPVAAENLQLTMATRREFAAGQPCEVTFILRNGGHDVVEIEEWRARVPENVRVFCQLWLPGAENPDPNLWLPIEPEPHRPDYRLPLTLQPGNLVFIPVPLPFVENLTVSPNSERRYFIKAELNLTSVKLESPVAAIAIQSGSPAAGKTKAAEASPADGKSASVK